MNNYNKMSEDEIKTLPYFKNYQKGIPSKVSVGIVYLNYYFCTYIEYCIFFAQTLYVKNIAKNVCEKHLISVFGKYKELQNTDIIYRYMKKGKMKGQAFIEFESKHCLVF